MKRLKDIKIPNGAISVGKPTFSPIVMKMSYRRSEDGTFLVNERGERVLEAVCRSLEAAQDVRRLLVGRP